MKQILMVAAAATFAACSANASDPRPPSFLVDPEYQGQIGGLDAWTGRHAEGVFLVLPEGQLVIGGTLYREPSSRETAAIPANSSLSSLDLWNQEAIRDDNFAHFLSALSDTMNEIEGIKADIEMMTSREVRSREPDVQATKAMQTDLLRRSVEQRKGLESAARVANGLTAEFREADPTLSGAPRLLESVRWTGFWFAMGQSDAPVVYAFIDPACPFCAQAIQALGSEIGEGALQLRVALAPVISVESFALIAAILDAEDPTTAFLEHEYDVQPLVPADWDALPDQAQESVIANVGIMKDHGVAGVPFFVFETRDGAETYSGVPTPHEFRDALPDPWQGNGTSVSLSGAAVQAD